MEIKELQELIERERVSEEKIRKAREEAQEIVKRAREKAESLVQSIESDPYQRKLRSAKEQEIVQKKAEIDREYEKKRTVLNKTAEKNFEKAIEFVNKEMLRVEI